MKKIVQMRRAIIIFTRVPEPRQTKTRIMPALSAKGYAHLHTYFLEDTKEECGKVEKQLFVCFTSDDGRERLYPVFGRGEHYISQRGNGLGERMYQVTREVLDRDYEACVFIGTDVPEVRSEYLERAFDLLEQNDMVLGPTRDGGYYLVGVKKPQRDVSDVEGYRQGSVLRDTMYRLKTAGCGVGLTETLWDADVYQDLQGYRQGMREDKRPQETSTKRYLAKTSRISIIIPVYNEEKTIVQMQNQPGPLRGKCEILFINGGNTDRTMGRIRPWVKVIHSEKGRARQINTGAMENHGDILFFLYYGSKLPPRPLAEIHRVVKNHSTGCFGITFHSSSFSMFTYRVISNYRIKDRRIMFGDQGISVDRSLFFDAGMFPEVPVAGNCQFSLTFKERGVKPGMTGRRVYTSDKHFPEGTLPKLKLMQKMNRLRKMYRDRAPIEQIDRMYQDAR